MIRWQLLLLVLICSVASGGGDVPPSARDDDCVVEWNDFPESAEPPHVHLSVVAGGRNDAYGGEPFSRRVQLFLDVWGAFACEAFSAARRAELVLVDYNPPPGASPLAAAVELPAPCPGLVLRIVQVPACVHAALSNPSRLPFLEHVAKNAGARAARGAFLLATNPDVLPSEALVRRLAEHTALDPGAFYRVDRQDLARGVPPARARARGLDAARRVLETCAEGAVAAHVSAAEGRFPGLTTVSRAAFRAGCAAGAGGDPRGRAVRDAGELHTNAAGDLFAVVRPRRLSHCIRSARGTWGGGSHGARQSAAAWGRLGGLAELGSNMEVDSHLCVQAAAAGLRQVLLLPPAELFHLAHSAAAREAREAAERSRPAPHNSK